VLPDIVPERPHPPSPVGDPRTAVEWAEQAGAYLAERDLLLEGIHAIQDGLADGTADAAWRNLLRRVAWLEKGR